MTRLTLATLALVALGLAPMATKNTPFVPNKVHLTAIDNGDDQEGAAERKEAPTRPHPLGPGKHYVVKARNSHSIAAIVD